MTHSPTHNKTIFRVAVASTDGYTVDTHFGRAYDFYIYQYLVDEWIFVEKRTVSPVCQDGQHSVAAMQKNISQFADCQYVVASKIGTGAMSALQSQGIVPMSLPMDINDALEKIYTYNEIQKLLA
jgi:predicted Fe-Mo cluster-binding NifX family protein